jgi:Kef-type K+ transport system membrane component KefB
VVAIGLTTTALGTLLPILRDNQMLEGRFGGFIMAAGAVGEFLPIVAIAIFLSASGAFLGFGLSCRHRGARVVIDVRSASSAPSVGQDDPR